MLLLWFSRQWAIAYLRFSPLLHVVSTWTKSRFTFEFYISRMIQNKDLRLLVFNRKCDFPFSCCFCAPEKGEHATLAGTSLIFPCPGLPTILFYAPRGRSVRATQLLHSSLPFSGAWKTTQGFQWGEVKMTPYNLASFLMISPYRVEVFLHGGNLSVHSFGSTLPSCPCHCKWSL